MYSPTKKMWVERLSILKEALLRGDGWFLPTLKWVAIIISILVAIAFAPFIPLIGWVILIPIITYMGDMDGDILFGGTCVTLMLTAALAVIYAFVPMPASMIKSAAEEQCFKSAATETVLHNGYVSYTEYVFHKYDCFTVSNDSHREALGVK